MRCEQIEEILPLYADDVLDLKDRELIRSHMSSCPICRDRHADYRELRLGLRTLGNPDMPAHLLNRLKTVANRRRGPAMFDFSGRRLRFREIVEHWLMPFSAGAFGSIAFAVLFLSFIFVRPGANLFGNFSESSNVRQMEATDNSSLADGELLRVEIPENSPEVNPAGALVALTRSIVRGKMNDEEVVVVADVFGNGIANITQVIDPPSDDAAMRELQRAFDTRPEEAPFLPARISRNSDAVRVVLKIQRVDVVR